MGRSLLHAACYGDNIQLVKTLILDYNADINCEDNFGITPIDVAAFRGRTNIALSLINDFNCDINTRDHSGRSLLHHACEGGSVQLVRTLITCESVSLLSTDNYGNTPLHICCDYDRVECVQALLTLNAPVLIGNKEGKTPAQVSVGRSKLVLDQYLTDNQHKLKIDYNTVLGLAEKRYCGEDPITRVFVLGNPEKLACRVTEKQKFIWKNT